MFSNSVYNRCTALVSVRTEKPFIADTNSTADNRQGLEVKENSSKFSHKWIIKQELRPEGRDPGTPPAAGDAASISGWIAH